MKEDQLTPWFPAEVKPVREGVYERDFGVPYEKKGYRNYCLFSDGTWKTFNSSPELAAKETFIVSIELPWRGLRSKP